MEAVAAELDGLPDQPLELYVNVPFCASKCHFCDWVTDIPVDRLRGDQTARSPYVAAVREQIRYYGPLLTRLGYQPHCMYWGGGTPTRLEPEEMRAIHEALEESFDLAGLVQWSMETTPNDLTAERLDTMRELGVNRVSVGCAVAGSGAAAPAGRAHNRDQALAAIDLLRAAASRTSTWT